jgi:two-component system, OmpR family, alkaline phosphatase synthesis response regulator PhoP
VLKRILVVEDNRELAFGLTNNLEIEGYEVEVAEDGATALELAHLARHDLMILDLGIPRLDGFRVLRDMRERHIPTPVLVLTARGEESDKVRALKIGADDYVTKPFSLLEFLARVEALLRRADRAGRQAATDTFGDVVVDHAARTVTRAGQPVVLTPKQFDLLAALLARPNAVVSRTELIRQVWAYEDSIVTRTVDTHIAELRKKLEADAAKPRHIITVQRIGYRLEVGG